MRHQRLSRFPVGPVNGLNAGGTVATTGRCITWHVGAYFAVHVDQSRPNPRYGGVYQRNDVYGNGAAPATRRFALYLN